jgi:hypothetical protein
MFDLSLAGLGRTELEQAVIGGSGVMTPPVVASVYGAALGEA